MDAPTGTALITIDEHGENHIVAVAGANSAVSLEAVTGRPEDALLCQLEIPAATVRAAAHRFPGFFALNAAPAQQLPADLLKRADLIIVNETEFAAMPQLSNCRLVAVTYGSRGATLLRHGAPLARATPPKVTAVDSVGAGDAFCAALVLAQHSGLEPCRALRAACHVGAIAVSHPGAQPTLPSLQEVLRDVNAGRTPAGATS